MIQPINQNLNSNSNLKPVEVPHFCGKVKKGAAVAKVGKSAPDSFKKSAKTASASDVNFGNGLSEFSKAAKKGVQDGVKVIGSTAKNVRDFTVSCARSLFSDTKEIVTKKGAKTIGVVNDLI